MFVDLLQGSVSECYIGALLRPSFLDFGQNGPVLDDLDAGELLKDPALRLVVGELCLFRFEPLVHRHHAFELFDIVPGVKRHPFNQRQNRRGAVRWRRGRSALNRPFALLGL